MTVFSIEFCIVKTNFSSAETFINTFKTGQTPE